MSATHRSKSQWRMLRIGSRLGSLMTATVERAFTLADIAAFGHGGQTYQLIPVTAASQDELRRMLRIGRLLTRHSR